MSASGTSVGVDVLAPAPRDGAALLAFVDRHRLAGFAAHALRDSDLAGALETRQQRSTMRALRHAAATVRVVRLLAENQIDAIPLKGALLGEQLYGDAAIRDVRDADLLIRPRYLLQADELLVDSGYQRVSPRRLPDPDTRNYRDLLTNSYHFEYTHRLEQVNLELHWRFPDWPGTSVDAIWENTEMRVWRGTPMRLIANDALLLLLLCDHGARHRWFLLKWLVDVAALLPRMSDVDGLLRMARRLDLERALGQTVLLCDQIFGIPIPSGLAALSRSADCQWLAAEARKAIDAPAEDYFATAHSLVRQLRQKRYLLRLRGQPGPEGVNRYPVRPLRWLQRRFLA